VKLPVLDAQRVVRLLAPRGFRIVGQHGSHVKLRDQAGRTVIVPVHAGGPLKVGTLKAILAAAGIPESDVREA
jgi:predicted RNA binding protein YcfA (HicA-like mRNA interferase family)